MVDVSDERQAEVERVAKINRAAGDWVETVPSDVIEFDPPDEPTQNPPNERQ